MEEKESDVDQAEYVFMQPIYAHTYATQNKQGESTDVIEKYVMNVLPEKYFNSEVDDGAEYAVCSPYNKMLTRPAKPSYRIPTTPAKVRISL
ncbi:unnamed protein product [Gongylonema pulchrum]|uniref:Uncharacterized protein n=1 Tax=Gongylonema pulchrum TaxID=637853 RepID=A0A183DG56_9BILA|nr:unnamed protein product [Gongylonema pulchrum]